LKESPVLIAELKQLPDEFGYSPAVTPNVIVRDESVPSLHA
jgi:hypothetical protein